MRVKCLAQEHNTTVELPSSENQLPVKQIVKSTLMPIFPPKTFQMKDYAQLKIRVIERDGSCFAGNFFMVKYGTGTYTRKFSCHTLPSPLNL